MSTDDERFKDLKPRSNVLLLGPPGDEKFEFGLKFIAKGLDEGDAGIIITLDKAPSEIEERGKEMGLDLGSHVGKDLVFIDCYSWTLGSTTGRQDITVPGPSALNDLSIGIAQAMQKLFKPERRIRVMFMSLSTLLLYNNPEIVYRFTQITGARLKNGNATTLFLMESGMHDDKVVNTIKHLMDRVVELKG